MEILLYRSSQKIIHKWSIFLPWLVVIIVPVGIIQDYLQSKLLNQGFYFSESLIFKAYLLPFIPVVALARYFRSYEIKSYVYRIAIPVILTALHLILYALSIYLLSLATIDHTYQFVPLLKMAFAEDLYKYLLIYSIGTLIWFKFKDLGNDPAPYPNKLIIPSGKNNIAIATNTIEYIIADDPYSAVVTATKKQLSTASLKMLLTQLDPQHFVRIHRSTIVNVAYVANYRSRLNGDYDLTLTNGKTLRLSRSYTKQFRSVLASYST